MRESVQGETVIITLDAAVPASPPTAFLIRRADGSTRIIAPTEQLILDSLIFSLQDSSESSDAYQVWAGPSSTPADPTNIYIGTFGSRYVDDQGNVTPFGTDIVEYLHEAITLPAGATPQCAAFVGGLTTIHFSGTGRIITTSTQIGRQDWQSRLM